MLTKKYVNFLIPLLLVLLAFAGDLSAKPRCCCNHKRVFDSPAAFEKIYVTQDEVVCTPDGIYLKHCDGSLEKVRSILSDCEGMYVLRILTQCPLCGQCYAGKGCPEDRSCPLYDKEIMPGLWGPP